MPADRTRGPTQGSIRKSRRDSCASNCSIPDTGRPTSPINGFSPYGTITPNSSRPGSPFGKQQMVRNFRKTNSSNQAFTALLAPTSPPPSRDASLSNSNRMDVDPSTITWECATAFVENQKVQTTYEKPILDENGILSSYGKMITKTVTMTITTTIASTEIINPNEEGYKASIERYNQQQQQQKEQQQQKTHTDTSRETKPFPDTSSHESNRLRQEIPNPSKPSCTSEQTSSPSSPSSPVQDATKPERC